MPTKQFRQWNIGFWVTIFRALLASFLGMALLFRPNTARPLLVNFMGVFWLASGIMSIRWSATGHPAHRSWTTLAGIVGVIAGLLALFRAVISDQFSDILVLNILGAVIILTGLIHITGGFRTAKEERHRTWASIILGIFEIVLGGLLLMAQSLQFGSLFYWTLTLWALIGGFLLFADALAQRRRVKQELLENL